MPRQKGTGRPAKLVPSRVAVLLQALEAGATRRGAAAAAEIDESTLRRWMKDAPFRAVIERAEATAEINYLTRIVKEIRKPDGQWTAAAWWLERRMPDVYGRRERLDVNLDIRREVEKLADELGIDKEAAIAEAERILGGRR